MCPIFSEKEQKRAKYLKIGQKCKKFEKKIEKGQPRACDYRMHETVRICPASVIGLLHKNSKQLKDKKMLYYRCLNGS